jgi:hypothetical protein
MRGILTDTSHFYLISHHNNYNYDNDRCVFKRNVGKQGFLLSGEAERMCGGVEIAISTEKMIVMNWGIWYTTYVYLVLKQNKDYRKFVNWHIDKKGAFMEAIKDINDFKHFLKMNRDKLYAVAENADDISLDDEWMQENQWDEIYKQGEQKDGKV